MMNFGKFSPSQENIEIDGNPVRGIIFMRNEAGDDLVDVLNANPHNFYIAVDEAGQIVSASNDPEQIQIDGYDIIGLDEDFGFTFGDSPTAIGAIWNSEAIIAPPEPVPVLSPRQLRLQLLAIGKLDDVPVVIASLPSPQRQAAEIEWKHATRFRRDHPLITTLSPLLGLSEEDVDTFWIQAAAIED